MFELDFWWPHSNACSFCFQRGKKSKSKLQKLCWVRCELVKVGIVDSSMQGGHGTWGRHFKPLCFFSLAKNFLLILQRHCDKCFQNLSFLMFQAHIKLIVLLLLVPSIVLKLDFNITKTSKADPLRMNKVSPRGKKTFFIFTENKC